MSLGLDVVRGWRSAMEAATLRIGGQIRHTYACQVSNPPQKHALGHSETLMRST